jgi:hypothetical protein
MLLVDDMIILALDALDYRYVKKFNCKHLMQAEFGKTDISEFELERTVILWTSFLAGKNMQKAVEPTLYFELERNIVKLASKLMSSKFKFQNYLGENFWVKVYRKLRWLLIGRREWNFKLPPEKTFLRFFDSYKVIDLPGFSYKKNHELEKIALRKFFKKEISIKEYEQIAWKNHFENKRELFKNTGKYDLLIAYFNLADVIGHLSFGIEKK